LFRCSGDTDHSFYFGTEGSWFLSFLVSVPSSAADAIAHFAAGFGGQSLMTCGAHGARIAAVFALIASLFFGVFHSYSAETVKVNQDLNGREIKVRVGGTIEIKLPQLGAAGYSWEIQDLDTEHFKLVSVKTEDQKNSGDVVGAPVMKVWSVTTIKDGQSSLTFLHYRPWEGEKNATDRFVLNVRILSTK
jgi:predicted secreted protein